MGILGGADTVEHDTPLGFVTFLVSMQVHGTKVAPIDLLVEKG
ncbi:MAG: hypothetical protein ABSA14_15100 [Acidimicrobiales bacterium]